MNEFEIIKKFLLPLSKKNLASLKLNDDIFFDKSKKLAVSLDTYVQGTHFLDFKNPDLVIKKILRASLSDLICKGVKPSYFFISASGNKKYFNYKNMSKITKSLNDEQKKFSIYLSGGDTVKSSLLSFSITSVGFSSKIIYRNKARINDDIYVTGSIGDSFIGLKSLKRKILLSHDLKKYFENKYYMPVLQLKLSKKLLEFANSSIDISDGLIADLEKLINNQRLSYRLYLNKIPISNKAKTLILKKTINLKNMICHGDDYQVLFTASPLKSEIIKNTCKKLGIKISLIGKICSYSKKSLIFDEKGNKINLKFKGYEHQF
tara:strand:- start:1571 stop:2530 length:960 start_codon:yes stop_codon:yes gene_type:complete